MPEQIKRIARLLQHSPLFAGVSAEAQNALAQEMKLIHIRSGDVLIKQGEIGDCLYILAQGRMRIYQQNDIKKILAEVGVGDIVGELALLVDTPRTANVQAVRDCTLIKISRKLFETIIREHPQSAMKIVSACVKRLLPEYSEKKHPIKTLAILPCQAAVEKETELAAIKLESALGRYARVNVLTSHHKDINALLAKSNDEIQDYLNEQEDKYDITLYVSDSDPTAWSQRCIRQADKILLVTQADSLVVSDVEKHLQQQNIIAEKILLILHSESEKIPSDTRKLIQHNPCNQHFHLGKTKDYERVARFLLGKAICLVLSGGGFRGLAHHGVIRAFEERNIPIDMIGGTSFGSLLAMGKAKGLTHEEMNSSWERLVKKISKVVDLTLPIASFAKGKILYDLLVESFPTTIDMEDLWLPGFCVATNLTDYDTYTIKQGPVWRAIRASMSLPGIFPPIIDNDKVLVDGATFNNLPVDLMRLINNNGIVIASVASSIPYHQHYLGDDKGVSGWKLFFNGMTGSKKTILPPISDVLVETSLAASTRHMLQMEALADYTFDLDVGHFKLLDVKNWKKVRDKGYASACKILDENGITRESLLS